MSIKFVYMVNIDQHGHKHVDDHRCKFASKSSPFLTPCQLYILLSTHTENDTWSNHYRFLFVIRSIYITQCYYSHWSLLFFSSLHIIPELSRPLTTFIDYHINSICLPAFISALNTQHHLTTFYPSSVVLLFQHSLFYILDKHIPLVCKTTSRPNPIHEWPQLFFTSKLLNTNLNVSQSTLISYYNLLLIKMIHQHLLRKTINSLLQPSPPPPTIPPPFPQQLCLNSTDCFPHTISCLC